MTLRNRISGTSRPERASLRHGRAGRPSAGGLYQHQGSADQGGGAGRYVFQQSNPITGLPTGWQDFDELIAGLPLWILAGVLRYNISLTVTLQAALVLALLCVLGFTFAISDVTD